MNSIPAREPTNPAPGQTEASTVLDGLWPLLEDAVIVASMDDVIRAINPAAEQMYGYTAVEVVGQPISRMISPERSIESGAVLRRCSAGETIREFETTHLTRYGRSLEVTVSATLLHSPEGEPAGVLRIIRDVTEARHTLLMLQQLQANDDNRAIVMETTGQVALDILASRTGVEALRHIAAAARKLAGAEFAALGVARPDGTGLQEFVSVGLTPDQEAAIGRRPQGAGILGLLLTSPEPIRIDRISEHQASVGFPPNHPVMTSFLGVPIRRGDAILGSLYLANKRRAWSFTEADAAAVEALGSHAAVAIHNMQLLLRQRALVSGLINAQEEERRAVAYDLHDGLTQYVMAAQAHLEAFRYARESGKSERATRELGHGMGYLKEAVIESRRLVNGLRSLALEDFGLAGAVEQLVAEEKIRAGWKDSEFIHNVAGRRFDKTLETAAYRVAQEALTNARRHSHTSRMRLMLLLTQDDRTRAPQLMLEARDWGIGFVPEHKMGEPGHMGLQGMLERVTVLGGSYEVRSSPGEGTRVIAVFPVLESQAETADGGIL